MWEKGRGKLGLLDPLIGAWVAQADSPQGPVQCPRRYERVRRGKYVRLEAWWEFSGQAYEELALIGAGESGKLAFWSLTSDGKRSQGDLAGGSDGHPEAIACEAQMPAGLARQLHWPGEGDSFHWAVEARMASSTSSSAPCRGRRPRQMLRRTG